jgi:ELWxxDGT repeat protein
VTRLGFRLTNLVNADGTLYFRGTGANTGAELWKSDGTPGGTVLVADIAHGTNGSQPNEMLFMGGTLFISAEDNDYGRELWVLPVEPHLPADFNYDSQVDGSDFLIWQRGLGLNVGASRSYGSADGDGDVDSDDLAIWQSNYGEPASTAAVVRLSGETPAEIQRIDLAFVDPATRRAQAADALFAAGDFTQLFAPAEASVPRGRYRPALRRPAI